MQGLDKFEGRSSFRTWFLRIVVNRAKSTGVREHRSIAIGDTSWRQSAHDDPISLDKGCRGHSNGWRTSTIASVLMRSSFRFNPL